MVARMPFGKHKGMLLEQIPSDYLRWLSTVDLHGWLRAAVSTEINRRMATPDDWQEDEERQRAAQENQWRKEEARRQQERNEWHNQERSSHRESFWDSMGQGTVLQPPAELRKPIAEILRKGFQAVISLNHPDKGGSPDAARNTIAARDWLRKHIDAEPK